jgi:hypothetical protein
MEYSKDGYVSSTCTERLVLPNAALYEPCNLGHSGLIGLKTRSTTCHRLYIYELLGGLADGLHTVGCATGNVAGVTRGKRQQGWLVRRGVSVVILQENKDLTT